MKYIVLFEDDAAAGPEVRSRHMSAHLAFLEENFETVIAAGPLLTGNGEGAGGLWLVDAADESQIDALVKADPFWPTGLRKSVRILKWNQVFADGHRLKPD
ncbi:MAG: YciI family protein [Hyphomicrobiaceae bacterium]